MRHFLLLLLLAGPLAAAPHRFASGENRTQLIELFTSEGCSSCPPAEAWLGRLRTARGLWRDFVPVAFHVVYWDRLGWRDRFARKEFTARQYAYAGEWRRDSVYTPGFVLDGAEWRRTAHPPGPSSARAGVLALTYDGEGVCRVEFAGEGEFEVHVVLLGGDIVSRVGAGENAGQALHHEFVALTLAGARLENGAARVALAVPTDPAVKRRALAAWITRRGELVPVQATGGWLD